MPGIRNVWMTPRLVTECRGCAPDPNPPPPPPACDSMTVDTRLAPIDTFHDTLGGATIVRRVYLGTCDTGAHGRVACENDVRCEQDGEVGP